MKILMINDNDPDAVVGGAERHIADVTQALEARGHEVHWFVFADRQTDSTRGPRKHVFTSPPTGRIASIFRHAVYYRAAHRALVDVIARQRPDVLHVHNNYRYPVAVLAATHGRPVVQTVHDYCAVYPTAHCTRRRSCAGRSLFAALIHGCLTWKLLATEACLLYGRRYLDRRLIKTFIAPSQDLAKHLDRMGYPRVRNLPNFCSLPDSAQPPPAATQIVLYVGSLTAHKGVNVLLAAFTRLASEAPLAELWFVGDGPAASGLKASASRSLARVRFFGRRPHHELPRFYRNARVVVVPSVWLENAPLVAVEAASCSRAIIASRTGGLAELVEDGRTGLLFDRLDVPDLAAKLRIMIGDRNLATQYGVANRERCARLNLPGTHVGGLLRSYAIARRTA